jgi:hypothetical protein
MTFSARMTAPRSFIGQPPSSIGSSRLREHRAIIVFLPRGRSGVKSHKLHFYPTRPFADFLPHVRRRPTEGRRTERPMANGQAALYDNKERVAAPTQLLFRTGLHMANRL